MTRSAIGTECGLQQEGGWAGDEYPSTSIAMTLGRRGGAVGNESAARCRPTSRIDMLRRNTLRATGDRLDAELTKHRKVQSIAVA